jgi:hypothetical protein
MRFCGCGNDAIVKSLQDLTYKERSPRFARDDEVVLKAVIARSEATQQSVGN